MDFKLMNVEKDEEKKKTVYLINVLSAVNVRHRLCNIYFVSKN